MNVDIEPSDPVEVKVVVNSGGAVVVVWPRLLVVVKNCVVVSVTL